jgi:hypothetical protein
MPDRPRHIRQTTPTWSGLVMDQSSSAIVHRLSTGADQEASCRVPRHLTALK